MTDTEFNLTVAEIKAYVKAHRFAALEGAEHETDSSGQDVHPSTGPRPAGYSHT